MKNVIRDGNCDGELDPRREVTLRPKAIRAALVGRRSQSMGSPEPRRSSAAVGWSGGLQAGRRRSTGGKGLPSNLISFHMDCCHVIPLCHLSPD
jgi:hypothetical protein